MKAERCINVVKKNGALYPCGDYAADKFNNIKDGREFLIQPYMPRNPKFHRYVFKLFTLVTESGACDLSLEQFLTYLKIANGYVQEFILPDGQVALIPKSISFASMNEPEFKEFFDKSLQLICDKILPHIEKYMHPLSPV